MFCTANKTPEGFVGGWGRGWCGGGGGGCVLQPGLLFLFPPRWVFKSPGVRRASQVSVKVQSRIERGGCWGVKGQTAAGTATRALWEKTRSVAGTLEDGRGNASAPIWATGRCEVDRLTSACSLRLGGVNYRHGAGVSRSLRPTQTFAFR